MINLTEISSTWFDRRTFLKFTGFGLLETATSIGTARTSKNESNHNEDVPKTDSTHEAIIVGSAIRLFRKDVVGHRQGVLADQPIPHILPWITVKDEDIKDLLRLFESTEYAFTIDGTDIDPGEGDWEIQRVPPRIGRNDQPQWRLQWTYTTPPKPTGSHEYEVTVTFTSPYTGKVGDGATKTWVGTDHHEGEYVVLPA